MKEPPHYLTTIFLHTDPPQIYTIQVTCRNGERYTIFRRYRQFDEMQRLLEQRFPVEAGEFSQKDRILPTLPGERERNGGGSEEEREEEER